MTALDFTLPSGQVPMQGRKSYTGRVALFKCSHTARIVAAEAVTHHHDFRRVDIWAFCYIVISGASGDFVIMARIKLSQAQRLALAGPIDRKGIPAAGGKFEAVEQHAHLLAVVHAIEDDDGRRPTRS